VPIRGAGAGVGASAGARCPCAVLSSRQPPKCLLFSDHVSYPDASKVDKTKTIFDIRLDIGSYNVKFYIVF
jgi:hypothetical protein